MQAADFIAGGAGAVFVSLIPVIGEIVGIVTTLLSFFLGGPDLSKITKAITDLATATGRALDQLKRFAWAIGRLALGSLLLLYRIINDMIGEIVKALRSIVAALGKLYEDVIKPALRAIRTIRGILNDIYNRWLRPIINAIQIVRRILSIFRAFGFKWAAALDARLARLEGRIIGPFLWIVRQLNHYTGWINVILTARGVLQRPIFRNSAYGNAGYLSDLFWTSQTAGQLGRPSAMSTIVDRPATLPEVQSQMALYVRSNTGPLAQAAATALATAQSLSAGV